MTATIEIAGRKIGAEYPPYVICELSGNHNGSLERALSPWGSVRIRRYYRTPLRNLLPFRQEGAAVFIFEVRPQSLRDAR